MINLEEVMEFIQRPRRLRVSGVMRDMAAETIISSDKLIMPYFVCEGDETRIAIESMPGIDRVSIDNLLKDVEKDIVLGVNAVLIFGIPEHKDDEATEAYSQSGIVQRAVGKLRKEFPDLMIITDVCLCEFMSHGHCGIVNDGIIVNDSSLELLAKTALSHAIAGADMVAPSDMMDGRVLAIREALDRNGFTQTGIMAYSAKYASAFYGPFREAAGSAPRFGDRRTYQMDFRNAIEAEKEVVMDIREGADIVMVKPALSYLDIIRRVKSISEVPVCAYNVSGEYSMVKASARLGMGNEQKLVTEIITSIFRSGADLVISYHTRDILRNRWI